MKTQSKIGCGNLIKTTALLLGFFAVFGGIIFVIVSIFGYIENGWVPGVICMLSGWVGGLILFGFGIIVDAHEDKAASENACAESAASASPVHPVFKAEDTEKVVPNIAPKNHLGNASNSAPKKTKEGWGCPRCSTVNPNYIGSCQNCGDPKPSGSTVTASSSQDPATVGWHCSRCGTENSKYVGNCIKCGTAKSQA